MAHRRRAPYEDQSARTSILAGAVAPRPDTLMQTCQIASQKALADGAGHTFFRSDPGPSDHASGAPGAPSGARTPCGAAPGSCSKGDKSCRNEQPSSGTDRRASRRYNRRGRARDRAGSPPPVPLPPPQSTVAAVDPWGDRAARPDPRCCSAALHRAALYRLRFLGHRIEPYAAIAAV